MVAVDKILALDQWLLWLSALSAVMFLGTLVALPFVILRLPDDFFVRECQPYGRVGKPRPKSLATLLIRNVCGLLMLAAGFLMLFLPGQGILTMVFGLALIQFPGKRRFYRWIFQKMNARPLFEKMNGLRRRFNRPPLHLPPVRGR